MNNLFVTLIIKTVAAQDEVAKVAHECRPTHDIQLLCTNQAENCNFATSVAINSSLTGQPDQCTAQTETCAMGKTEDGKYNGSCDFNPKLIQAVCRGDQKCVIDEAAKCHEKDEDSCNRPCIWHAQCTNSPTYCEQHLDCHLDEGCGHGDLTCPSLLPEGEAFIHFACANLKVAEQLDEYCLHKESMLSHNIAIYVLEVVAAIAIAAVVVMKGLLTNAVDVAYVDIGIASLATYWLCSALSDTLHLSTQYSDRAVWFYAFGPFSPHWVIFTMASFTFFYYVQALYTVKCTARNRAIVELFVECFALGCLIGGQWESGTKWCAAIIAIVYLWMRTSRSCLCSLGAKPAALVGCAMSVPLFLGDFITTNYFLKPATGLEGSSAFFATMAAAHVVFALFSINRGTAACRTKLHIILLAAAMSAGTGVCIAAFYERPNHSAAFNEMVMWNVAHGHGLTPSEHQHR